MANRERIDVKPKKGCLCSFKMLKGPANIKDTFNSLGSEIFPKSHIGTKMNSNKFFSI